MTDDPFPYGTAEVTFKRPPGQGGAGFTLKITTRAMYALAIHEFHAAAKRVSAAAGTEFIEAITPDE